MSMFDPVFATKLIPEIDRKLIEILKTLAPEDWNLQTSAPKWKVKDIAAHLLDGNLRNLSSSRDHFFGDPPGKIESYQDLLDYLNKLNADWVSAMKRVSPDILIQWLEQSGKEYAEHLQSLDLAGKAIFSVGWAGEEESTTAFHIAREYTEKWHHQQQIRLAVGQTEELYTEELYLPFLETCMKALPYHYREVAGRQDDAIQFTIPLEKDENWFLQYDGISWNLLKKCTVLPLSRVVIEKEVAWRIFTKGLNKETARKHVNINGDEQLGGKIFDMLTVMA
ncbi:TIGR03083 family protein [Pseudarcicella hirudinis]|uniref:TIGR03083 family protein n=2 Tax=Pseudarcicella hirudinis TaxID=1079859 RepID=A0A1I5WEZ9_9BACT|nr:maleylpyruvate isomerase N-terminal domain-containing protein [Pseudarcicella hirudinis]SFQ17996.1 TIGR03083 family protein [Pseudarcicella hirudinis]